MSRVLIGIQARSGSTRLPRKAFEIISGKMLLDRVIDACKNAASYLCNTTRGVVLPQVVVLTPYGDPIAEEFAGRCQIIQGPEHDVLARYRKALDVIQDVAHVVRVTGDCPLVPPYVISKMITLARMNYYDYVSNVDELHRTALDGADCEVMSRAMLEWLAEIASLPADREHVTLLARRVPPDWAKIGCVVNHYDHSDVKLSVDTKDDLERVRAHFEQADGKYQKAVQRFGQKAVHRL